MSGRTDGGPAFPGTAVMNHVGRAMPAARPLTFATREEARKHRRQFRATFGSGGLRAIVVPVRIAMVETPTLEVAKRGTAWGGTCNRAPGAHLPEGTMIAVRDGWAIVGTYRRGEPVTVKLHDQVAQIDTPHRIEVPG